MAVNFIDTTMSLENDHLETSLYVKPMDCYNYLPFHGEYAVKDRKWQDFKHNCTVKAAQLRWKGYPQTLIWEAYARARDKSRDAPLTYKNRTHLWQAKWVNLVKHCFTIVKLCFTMVKQCFTRVKHSFTP